MSRKTTGRHELRVLSVYVQPDDHVRLKALATGSVAEFVRGCIDDYLESIDEPILRSLNARGRPRLS
jgi:hypothetical protein